MKMMIALLLTAIAINANAQAKNPYAGPAEKDFKRVEGVRKDAAKKIELDQQIAAAKKLAALAVGDLAQIENISQDGQIELQWFAPSLFYVRMSDHSVCNGVIKTEVIGDQSDLGRTCVSKDNVKIVCLSEDGLHDHKFDSDIYNLEHKDAPPKYGIDQDCS